MKNYLYSPDDLAFRFILSRSFYAEKELRE
jgi:hypothetical protein